MTALLETARALSEGPRLRNDVIFLFTDGEEPGLLGAEAFVEEHPLADDLGIALKFEARGNGGPSMMFETSTNNIRLVEEFASAAPRPVASSATYEVYKRTPSGDDLIEFRKAGMAGLGFSYFRGATHYHTALDTPSSVARGACSTTTPTPWRGTSGVRIWQILGPAPPGRARRSTSTCSGCSWSTTLPDGP